MGKKMAKFRFFGFEFMNLKKLNQILYCKQICKFNHLASCFFKGERG